MDSGQQHQKELLAIKRRRLQELEREEAFKGWSTPPEIKMEIAQIREEIDKLTRLVLEAAPINTTPFVRREDTVFSDIPIAGMGAHLAEWKVVHTTAQKLLMNIPRYLIERVIHAPTEERMFDLEERWSTHCGPLVRDIIQSYKELKIIRNTSINDIIYFLNSDRYIARIIGRMRTDENISTGDLQFSYDELLSLLENIMRISDIYISEIAKYLMEK